MFFSGVKNSVEFGVEEYNQIFPEPYYSVLCMWNKIQACMCIYMLNQGYHYDQNFQLASHCYSDLAIGTT